MTLPAGGYWLHSRRFHFCGLGFLAFMTVGIFITLLEKSEIAGNLDSRKTKLTIIRLNCLIQKIRARFVSNRNVYRQKRPFHTAMDSSTHNCFALEAIFNSLEMSPGST